MFTTWRIVRPLRARLAPFACFEERGGGRAFKGSEVDLTSRRRYEEPKRKEAMHAREYMPNLRFDRIKTANIPQYVYNVLIGYFNLTMFPLKKQWSLYYDILIRRVKVNFSCFAKKHLTR